MRELIEAGTAKHVSDPGHPRVDSHLENRPRHLVAGLKLPDTVLRIGVHRAEFVKAKTATVNPHPVLDEKCAPRRVKPYCNNDRQPDRERRQQPDTREHHIQHSFEGALIWKVLERGNLQAKTRVDMIHPPCSLHLLLS